MIGVAVLFAASQGLPFSLSLGSAQPLHGLAIMALVAITVIPLGKILSGLPAGALYRHEFERCVIRFLTGWGSVFLAAIVAIPFFIMVMTSFKSQQDLLANPLDYSLDLEKGWALLRSYVELFMDFHFGQYLLISARGLGSDCTHHTAVERARGLCGCKAAFQAAVPVLPLDPLDLHGADDRSGATDLYRFLIDRTPEFDRGNPSHLSGYDNSGRAVHAAGYFRSLPAEVEEAGLMDGLSRLGVIWKITIPLSLPAMASVSLYVFMIAWNEFLLAFMLLDDPSIFTLTRGVAMLNSSEIPRQHLMAGSVIATVPIMLIFLALERFMTKGLTAGSVKG